MNLRPKIIISVTLVIVFLILLSLAQEMNRRWQIEREVALLDEEVSNLQKSVIELENLNQYFRTDDYQERLAREKLNYRAPGENVVLIPEEELTTPEAESLPQAESEQSVSIPMRWWQIFFVNPEGARGVNDLSRV